VTFILVVEDKVEKILDLAQELASHLPAMQKVLCHWLIFPPFSKSGPVLVQSLQENRSADHKSVGSIVFGNHLTLGFLFWITFFGKLCCFLRKLFSYISAGKDKFHEH